MNLNLNYEGFEEYLVEKKESPDGWEVKYIFEFENGCGAIVHKGHFSWGSYDDLWELTGVGCTFNESSIICDNMRGYLTDKNVRELLEQIKGL